MNLRVRCVDQVADDLKRLSTNLDHLMVKFFECHSINEGNGEIKLIVKPSPLLNELNEFVERLMKRGGVDEQL